MQRYINSQNDRMKSAVFEIRPNNYKTLMIRFTLTTCQYLKNRDFKRSRGRQTKIWMDNVKEDLKEKSVDLTMIGEATTNRGLDEFCKSLIVSTLMEEIKREKKRRRK